MKVKYIPPSRRKPALGTVSRANLRPEDLILSLMDALEIYNPKRVRELEVNGKEEHDFLIDSLCGALEKVADRLPYCYFGASEGNMRVFGFWIDVHSLDEAIAQGDILEIDHEFSYPTWSAMKGKDYFFFCHPDHAEMVLWSKNYKELWRD
jgi:hypothetical protein